MLPKKEVQTLVQAAKAERRTLFDRPYYLEKFALPPLTG